MNFTGYSNHQTPYYLYNIGLLKETLQLLNVHAKKYNFHVHYALKANTNERVMEEIVNFGLGADCVSGNEILHALKCGVPAHQIVFAGVGKADWEIELAIENGIHIFNCESLEEITVINEIAQQKQKIVDIAIRVNPNVDAKTHEKITTGLRSNKFGVNYNELLPVLKKIEHLNNIKFTGLHFHIGSQITHLDAFKELCAKVKWIQTELLENGIEVAYLNVGGGLGIDYEAPEINPIPDFERYFKIFNDHLEKVSGQQVHFELGRSIVGNIGELVAKVLYTKNVGETNYVILDAGMTELMRPALYESYHKIDNISTKSDSVALYDVVGPICESSDYFAKQRLLPSTKRGDLFVIHSTGAYGEVMSSNYNLRGYPNIVINE